MPNYHLLFDPQNEINFSRTIPVDNKELDKLIESILQDLFYAGADPIHECEWTLGDQLLHSLRSHLLEFHRLLKDSEYDDSYAKKVAHMLRGYQLRLGIMSVSCDLTRTMNLLRECFYQRADRQYHVDISVLESQASHSFCPARQTDGSSTPRVEPKFVLRTSGASTKITPKVAQQDSTNFASFSASKIPDDGTYQSHLKQLREAMTNRSRQQFNADPKMLARQDFGLDHQLREISTLAPTSSPFARQEIILNGTQSIEEEEEY